MYIIRRRHYLLLSRLSCGMTSFLTVRTFRPPDCSCLACAESRRIRLMLGEGEFETGLGMLGVEVHKRVQSKNAAR